MIHLKLFEVHKGNFNKTYNIGRGAAGTFKLYDLCWFGIFHRCSCGIKILATKSAHSPGKSDDWAKSFQSLLVSLWENQSCFSIITLNQGFSTFDRSFQAWIAIADPLVSSVEYSWVKESISNNWRAANHLPRTMFSRDTGTLKRLLSL